MVLPKIVLKTIPCLHAASPQDFALQSSKKHLAITTHFGLELVIYGLRRGLSMTDYKDKQAPGSEPSSGVSHDHFASEKGAEARAQAFAAAKARLMERAKAAKAAYLERPEVKARMAAHKERIRQRLAAQRKKRSDQLKALKKQEKEALAQSKSLARKRRQSQRDDELTPLIGRASDLAESSSTHLTERPTLTVIRGGRSSEI